MYLKRIFPILLLLLLFSLLSFSTDLSLHSSVSYLENINTNKVINENLEEIVLYGNTLENGDDSEGKCNPHDWQVIGEDKGHTDYHHWRVYIYQCSKCKAISKQAGPPQSHTCPESHTKMLSNSTHHWEVKYFEKCTTEYCDYVKPPEEGPKELHAPVPVEGSGRAQTGSHGYKVSCEVDTKCSVCGYTGLPSTYRYHTPGSRCIYCGVTLEVPKDEMKKFNEDLEQLFEENIKREKEEWLKWLEENKENLSGIAGDPVQYTTGNYVSKSTDLIFDNSLFNIEIVRNYSNANQRSFSFGKGWNFNYDTRIIMGINYNYTQRKEETEKIVAEITNVYNMAKEVQEHTNYDFDMNYIRKAYEEALELLENTQKEAEYSSVYEQRNAYTVDRRVEGDKDKIGIGKLILINEEGVPQTYRIKEDPVYDSTKILSDGTINFYPYGSQTEADDPQADKLEIMPDGSYVLTKKDGTKYFYSYIGKLVRIEDTNSRYLDFIYNENNELVKITDTFDRSILIERSNGKITQITDPLGRKHKYAYSGDRLVAYTDPEGNTRRYTYSEAGLTATIYPDGNGWNYYYTELDGRMVVDYQTDASGAIIDFEYDPVAGETTVTDRRGNKTIYRYNDNHLTIEEIDPEYGRVYKSYDENNNLISLTNKRGYTTYYTYDENNNITGVTDPEGSVHFTYNRFNKISSITDKKGYTTTFNYDHRGNLIAINYPDGGSRRFEYNNLGLLVLEIDQRGYQTRYTYDDYGNIAEIIYPDGSVEKYEHDIVGRLNKLIKADGGEIIFYYDNNDNIVKVVDELGYEESFKYNSRNKLIEKIDPNGNVTRYEYDERNNLKTIIDPAGNIQEIEYDEAENMIKKVLAENVSYIYQYDSLDRLISAIQVETGIETGYKYDPADNLIAITDGEGRTTSFEYDALNRKIREKDPLNNIISYTYYPDNSLRSITDKRGHSTYFKYDSMGRLVEVTNELGQKVSYEYDKAGNLIRKVDARGNSTLYEYDAMNRLIKEIDSLGNKISYAYDKAGNLISITDSEGNTTTFKYDLKGRVIEEINALGHSRYYEYDGMGNLISLINEAGIRTLYRYDELNRLIEIEDNLGNITKIGYTPLGEVAWREDALGNRYEFIYDSANRLIEEIDPEGNSIKYSYDKAGNLIAVIDELGEVTEYQYDELNRLIKVLDALNNSVSYNYDANGNIIEMINENGHSYRYQYDELDRLAKEINYLGNEQTYSYDANGNLLVKVDFNGNRTNYNYDELNRLVEVIFADGSRNEFAYNANGEMIAAINENSSQRYYYDELSRLVRAEIENKYDRYTVEYEYNELGQRTRVILDDGNILQNRETKYYYDEAMRLSKVELPDGETVSYRYDELNRVISQINSNRTGTNYTYTPAGRIKSIEHFKGLNGHGQVLLSYAYIYNARGQRILEVEGNGQVTAYQYDPVGRLTKVYYPFSGGKKEINRIERAHYFGLEVNLDNYKEYYRQKNNPDEYIAKLLYDYRNELDVLHREIRESGRPLDLYNNGYYIEEYRYDPAGNVIMEGNAWGTINFEYNAANQLIRAGNRTYSYDANGNLIKEGYGGDYVEYSYNYENRLIKASNLSRNDKLFGGEHPFTGTITFAYDALGRKVVKELAPANINRVMINGYYYDGGGVNILAEYDDFIWDINQYRLGKKNTTGQIPGGQVKYFNEYYYGLDLLAFNNMNHPNPWYINRDINFYHKDALGSITSITDRYENVVERYRYDAYGNPYEGRFLHMSKNNPYGFTGQRFEPELRMYSFAYRTYNPMSMRWMTVDPVRDGTNWYLYVSGDPVNWIDLLGLKTWLIHGTFSGPETFPEEFEKAVATHLNDTTARFGWSGENISEERTRAAKKLAVEIIAYKRENPDEPINLIGHSHGGNVAIEACNLLAKEGIEVDNLITMGTPVREDYQLKGNNVKKHTNIYSNRDMTQIIGGGTIRLPKIGEAGPAGRTFDNAHNIKDTNFGDLYITVSIKDKFKIPIVMDVPGLFTYNHSVFYQNPDSYNSWLPLVVGQEPDMEICD